MQGDWTDTRIAILKDLWTRGESAASIAAVLGGVTRNAVIGKAHRLDLPSRQILSVKPRKPKSPRPPQWDRKIKLPREPNKPPRAIVTPILDKAIPLEQRKTVYTLEWQHCHFPVGEPGTPDFFYCGGVVGDNDGRRYCAAHKERMYLPTKSRARRETPHPANVCDRLACR
jgi:GcrA cell cycle regulator